jgi:dipeptidyl aminopeptidase/acylaminoacyl peptidase
MELSILKTVLAAVAIAWIASLARGSSISEKRIELLFRPQRGEQMALSPDGNYLAYTEHVGHELTIVVFDLQRLTIKTRIVADEDRLILHSKERERAQLRFLRWGADNRLIFAPGIEVIGAVATQPPSILAPIMAVDADGKRPRQLLDAKDLQQEIVSLSPPPAPESATPLPTPVMYMPRLNIPGFATAARDALLVEAVGRAGTPGVTLDIDTRIMRVDVGTGKVSMLHSAPPMGHLLYDRQGRARLQQFKERRSSEEQFLYQAVESGRWRKLDDAAGNKEMRFTTALHDYFGERALPLGFDFDPNVLIYASNAGRETFGVYGLDLKSGQRTPLAIEHPGYDLGAFVGSALPSPALVFDEHQQRFVGVRVRGARPFTIWLDAELAAVQRTVEAKFPQRTVRILEWADLRMEFLCRVTGGTEPGRIYLYRRGEDALTELSRAAPWLPNAELHATQFFEFEGPGGAAISGFLTLPRAPRLNPPPLIIWFATGLPPQPHPEFSAQAQVLADMGFAVCRLNYRGLVGFGARERDVLRANIDGVPAADALAAIEWIASRHRIDRKRVATMGEGFAGLLAIRATQLYPDAFRCAVAFEPILDPAAWVEPPAESSAPPSFEQRVNRLFLTGKGSDLRRLSPLAHPDRLNAPVFFTKRITPRSATDVAVAGGTSRLHGQLKRRDIPSVVAEIHDDYVAGSPGARTRLYRKLEEFFNLNLYDYNVKIGPTREVK